jgi:hypothetical protein
MKKFIALCIFGIAFGLLEAIVVFYLQTIVGNLVARQLPQQDYSVLLNLGIVAFVVFKYPLLKSTHITSVEMLREFSTIIMLLSLAYIAGKNMQQRIGAFLVAFAFWDIFYYIFLLFLIGWPKSLLSLDVLFLLPVPWIGPVITPVIISIICIIIGVKLFLTIEKTKNSI